jgi:hypothetical protein
VNYPKSYHIAMQHLIHHGAYGHSQLGRDRCARALRELRKRGFGPEIVQLEWQHMRFICGHMPIKTGGRK